MVDKMVELGFLGQNSNIKSCVFLEQEEYVFTSGAKLYLVCRR